MRLDIGKVLLGIVEAALISSGILVDSILHGDFSWRMSQGKVCLMAHHSETFIIK